jgi:predicted Zn-dependent protease with MMP-like domain
MLELDDQEFTYLVTQGLMDIPERFRRQLNNVVVVWAEEPSPEQLRQTNLKRGQALFGLYEGVPQISRGVGYSGLPDKITIFKKAILNSCNSLAEVREQVAETVWHELAHHFGSSEQRVRNAQHRRHLRRS